MIMIFINIVYALFQSPRVKNDPVQVRNTLYACFEKLTNIIMYLY